MITRILQIPNRSFLLLGPRGTGKSTLIRSSQSFDLQIDLLQSKFFLPLSSNPSMLEDWTQDLSAGAWIYIDEVQKIPALLDEVHSLYESRKFHFALSGSSARKLWRGAANLLAGRALTFHLFPMTYIEYQNVWDVNSALRWGSLPQTLTEPEFRADFLTSYVETYLRQELMEEGLIRRLEPFYRALNVIGHHNGQVLNIENISRESHVGRTSVDRYFQVLEDTLLGFRLPSFRPKWNRNESHHSKFYLFDPGVARACAGTLNTEPDPSSLGFLFESLVMNEVRAHNSYLKAAHSLYYYKFHNGYEIDLLIETSRKSISSQAQLTAVEIKFANRWDKRWNAPLMDIQKKSNGQINRLIGVYRGPTHLDFGQIKVYPVEDFLLRLAKGEFFHQPKS